MPEALGANANSMLTMTYQKDMEKRQHQHQREIKHLKQELRRKNRALAEAAALLMASKKTQAYWEEGGED